VVVVAVNHGRSPAVLGQSVFYTLSDLDRSALGAMRSPVFPAVVTEAHDDTATLHVFVPNPARPILIRPGVRAGEPGQPGRWSTEAP
jgi:hypothetical protein